MLLAVRLNAVSLLVVLVTAVIHLPKRSSDPVAVICSPLCEVETGLEMDCALSRGCYDIIDQDSDTFFDCLTPCWKIASPCFSLCAESFDLILNECYNICKSTPDDQVCIVSCYHIMFFDLKYDRLYGGLNDTQSNDSSTAQVDTETSSSRSENSFVDSSSTLATPRFTSVILAALEINQFLEESFTAHLAQPVSDSETPLKYIDRSYAFEVPGLTEKVEDVRANAIEGATVTGGLGLLGVLTRTQSQKNSSAFESTQRTLPEPTKATDNAISGQLYENYGNQFDDKLFKMLLESYDRPIGDYFKSKYFDRKNFSVLSQNASELNPFWKTAERVLSANSTSSLPSEITAVQDSNTLTDTRVNQMKGQGSKRHTDERQKYLDVLKKANLKFLQLNGLIGPLPKDATLEAYLEISRRRTGLDSPVLIG